ncbi:hypothetical protein GH733_005015, partial [Mirounga leonina]
FSVLFFVFVFSFITGCELKADKDYHFKVDNDENEHQLSLRTVSLGAGAKDELHIVEAEAMNYEGSPIKVTLATLKMSVQPTVRALKLWVLCQAVEEDAESEDEEEEDVKLLSISGKRSAPGSGSKVPQKKVKLAADEDDDEDDDDDDDDEEYTFFLKKISEPVIISLLSIRDTPAKNAQKSNQNGKDSKPSTPRTKGQESFKKQEKTPKTPKGPSSVEDIKAKMQASIEKGGSLPKVEAKFINYVKNCFRMTDQEVTEFSGDMTKSKYFIVIYLFIILLV